jgi:hypothetical protein
MLWEGDAQRAAAAGAAIQRNGSPAATSGGGLRRACGQPPWSPSWRMPRARDRPQAWRSPGRAERLRTTFAAAEGLALDGHGHAGTRARHGASGPAHSQQRGTNCLRVSRPSRMAASARDHAAVGKGQRGTVRPAGALRIRPMPSAAATACAPDLPVVGNACVGKPADGDGRPVRTGRRGDQARPAAPQTRVARARAAMTPPAPA